MHPSQKPNLAESDIFVWALLLLALSIWSYFSFNNWITDSEFWPISLSGHWDQVKEQPALMFKSLFHLSLSWIYLIDLDSVQHLKVAKAYYTILGCGSFLTMFKILKNDLGKIKALYLVVALIFSNLGFSQIGVIRSDFLSYFCLLFFFIIFPKISSLSWIKFALMSFLFSLLLFLITPKSLFFALIVFVFSLLCVQKGYPRFRFVLLFGWLAIISGVMANYLFSDLPLENALAAVTQFLVDSYFESKNHYLLNTEIMKFVKNDFLIWITLLGGLVFQFVTQIKNKTDFKWTALGILTLLIIFIHRPTVPFFVGAYWGILFISIIPTLKKCSPKFIAILPIMTVIVLGLRYSSTYHASNSSIYEAILQIENFIKQIPNASIFDGLATTPRSPNQLFYIGPDSPLSNDQTFEKVKAEKPELIIYAARLTMLEPHLGVFLSENYRPIGVGYWLRKDVITDQNLEKAPPAFMVFTYSPPTADSLN